MSIRQTLTGLTIAAGIASAATAGLAQETNLKVAMVFPQTHWHWTYGLDPFMKEAEKLSGGKLTFESYPAGQLGKETTLLVTSGLAEIGLLVPSCETDKLPRTGAIPVKVTATELYDALSRGTVDGAFWPIGSTKMQGLENLIKYTVRGPQLGAGATLFAISEKAWQKLDSETQQALMQAGETTMASLCQHLDEDDARVTKELVDEGLLEVTRLTPEEEAAWADRIKGVGDEWAREMDSTGRLGSELLEAYRALSSGDGSPS